MHRLRLTKFGNPILRDTARRLTAEEVRSPEIQTLLDDMRAYLDGHPETGVGIAAPQLNVPLAISYISIRPTDYRPNVETIALELINPKIVTYYGESSEMWEGCLSFGAGGGAEDFPYARAERYAKIRLRFMDRKGVVHEDDFEGIVAHVMQHETDHLNGILFVDRVKDPHTYMMKSEYLKHHKRGERG